MLFAACFAIILTMYGGGFATMPSYIADVFGPREVGAIHGRVLTALSVAGIIGPVLVNYLREYHLQRGVETGHAYDVTMYIMAGLLVIGFFCNRAVKPIHSDSGSEEASRGRVSRAAVDSESSIRQEEFV